MDRSDYANRLERWAGDRGYRLAWGNAAVVAEARDDFEELHADDALSEKLSKDYLSGFSYLETESLEEPRSVVIVAIPRPAHRLVFTLEKGTIITLLPPTYVEYNRLHDSTLQDLKASGVLGSHSAELLKAPLKSIAVRLGLASYGRNNIAYVDGIGSYFQLVGLITDAALPDVPAEDPPGEGIRPECADCSLCAEACPTGAIHCRRRLIDHERCFTLLNESAEPWPRWMKRLLGKCFSRNDCLVGCLACQESCPINRGMLKTVTAGISFTPDETASLLGRRPDEKMDAERAIRLKLGRIGMEHYFDQVSRNLKAIYGAGR